MVGTHKINRTTTPSGVFRQPREDLLQDSVSQCLVNQDSLCKVSDFEISIHSKYNLPDLYNVDGKGRAVYWLYKHSLADSESVRNNKAKPSMVAESTTALNETTLASKRSGKSILKRRKMKKKLSKLRNIFLSSTTSDIEIKETYNSYVNLNDLETVDVLLKSNQSLSMDKYDNLIKNLELRKIALEEHNSTKCNEIIAESQNARIKESSSRIYNLEKYLNNIKSHTESLMKTKHKKLRHRKNETRKVPSLVCKSTETDLLTRSGLEHNDLDHILNQMKFFLQSGKFNNITQAQKAKLEEYLRVLTKDSYRSHMKKELCRGTICRRLQDNIRESLRDVVLNTEMRKTSSLIVETDSEPEIYASKNSKAVKRLKGSQAKPTISVDKKAIGSSIVSDADTGVTTSYQTTHSNLPKNMCEKVLKCQDLSVACKTKDVKTEDINDELLFKHCHLDSKDVLLNFPKPKKSGSKHKLNTKNEEAEKLNKFKSVRNFDESDTFKALEMKQKQKNFQYNVKYPPQHSNHNICISEPDNISYYGELDEMVNNEVRVLPESVVEPKVRDTKQRKPNKTNPETSISEVFNAAKEIKTEEQRKLWKISSKLSLKLSRKSSAEIELNKESIYSLKAVNGAADIDNCVCFRDTVQMSSDSSNETKEKQKITSVQFNTNNRIKSYSFPKSKQVVYGNNADKDPVESQQKGHQLKEKKRKDKRKKGEEGENKKLTKSENCIENQIRQPKSKNKYTVEENDVSKEKPKLDVKQPAEKEKDKKETEDAKASDYKLFLKINAFDKNNVKITSYTRKIKSNESLLQSDLLREITALHRDADEEISSKQTTKPANCATGLTKSADSVRPPRLAITTSESSSNHVIQINDSLIHLDERHIFKSKEEESMETIMKNDMLSKLHKSLVPNECQNTIDCSVNIPIYKQGCEIARITRQSPSCAYTIKKYVQKMNKSTQMFEHVTRNDLYTLQWIHDNLFEININPHTLIVDEKIKEVSEMSDVS